MLLKLKDGSLYKKERMSQHPSFSN